MHNQASDPVRTRGRGKRAGLDLPQILRAARALPAQSLTMQALADVLQVDRSALNHHVSDRTTLLGLVAMDAFSGSFETVDVSSAEDWRTACRSFANGFVDSILSTGELAEYLWFGDTLVSRYLGPIEALFAHFRESGFDDESAVRLITLLSSICLGYARDVTQANAEVERPRPRALKAALAAVDASSVPNLHRIASIGVDTYARPQLHLSIDVFLVGAASLLPSVSRH